MPTKPRLTYPITKTVRDWLGLTPFEASHVVDILLELTEDRGQDTDDLSTADLRKLADEAFEIYQSEEAYQGFAYKLEG